jgi:hypothetical protein
VKRNPAKALAYLDAISGQLGPVATSTETVLLDAAQATSSSDFLELYSSLVSLPAKERVSIVRRVRWINANAFVFFIQRRLTELEIFSGKLDGRLTLATIKAISQYCKQKQISDVCRLGPLHGSASSMLAQMYG